MNYILIFYTLPILNTYSNKIKCQISHMYLRETGTKEKNIVTYTTDVKHDKKKK